jgi:hypothetical protein
MGQRTKTGSREGLANGLDFIPSQVKIKQVGIPPITVIDAGLARTI